MPVSKCLDAYHNTRATCKPSCVWRDDKCAPGRRSTSPRKPTDWNNMVAKIAKQNRDAGRTMDGPALFKAASARYRNQSPPDRKQRLQRRDNVRNQHKERAGLYDQFRASFDRESDKVSSEFSGGNSKVYVVYSLFVKDGDRDEVNIVGVYQNREEAADAASFAAKNLTDMIDIPDDLDEHFLTNDDYVAHDEDQHHIYVGLTERRVGESYFDEVVAEHS